MGTGKGGGGKLYVVVKVLTQLRLESLVTGRLFHPHLDLRRCPPCRAMGSKPSWVKELAQALLRVEDANVLVVDWIYRASFAYILVVHGYKEVAVQVSILVNQLQVIVRIYFVCFSLQGRIWDAGN